MRILRRRMMRMMIFEEGSENIVIILILRKMKYINILVLEDEKIIFFNFYFFGIEKHIINYDNIYIYISLYLFQNIKYDFYKIIFLKFIRIF